VASTKIPYISSLPKLRWLLNEAARVGDLAEAARAATLKGERFHSYYAEAAEALKLAERRYGQLVLSAQGNELLQTEPGSAEEAAVFRRVIEASDIIMRVVPTLLDSPGPADAEEIIESLRSAGDTPSMATQRGGGLWRCRTYLLQKPQLTLPNVVASRYDGRTLLRAIEIRNFKSFGTTKGRGTRIKTSRLTILAGPNGAGKSTVLQALNVLGSLVRGNIEQLLDAHKWDYFDLPHLLSANQKMTLGVEVEMGRSVLRWELTLGARRYPGIAAETVHTRNVKDKDEEWRLLLDRKGRNATLIRESTAEHDKYPPLSYPQSWLGTLAKEDAAKYPGLLALKQWAERIRPLWLLDPTLLREPSQASATHVGERGNNLASFLHELKGRDPKHFAAFVKRVRRHYPRLVDVEPKSQDGWKYLAIKERWNREQKSFNAKQVSDGLLRLLAIASIPYWEQRPSIMLLDEIENGLHPRLVGGVAGLLEEISETTQVIATTHSPITLNYVPDSSAILVTRGRSGTVQVTPLTQTVGYERLRAQLEPGELWYNVGEERLVQSTYSRTTS